MAKERAAVSITAVRREPDGQAWTRAAYVRDGAFRIGGLPAGRYDLYVIPHGADPAKLGGLTPVLTGVDAGGEAVEIR